MVDANSPKIDIDNNGSGSADSNLTYNYTEQNEYQEIHDKVNNLTREVDYLRNVIDSQNTKIDRLIRICSGYFDDKREAALIRAIRDDVDLGGSVELDQLESNMDPALHQVAVAAAAVHAQSLDIPKQKKARKSNDIDEGDVDASATGYEDKKKPKISVNFLHNPMLIKEIYDEFTKGYQGQMALKEMDSKYGKHEWRGDSRSKELKRFQRRKRLHDAIERGVLKYEKTAEEIILYIEGFRGERSLTWVMNGNLPPDLA